MLARCGAVTIVGLVGAYGVVAGARAAGAFGGVSALAATLSAVGLALKADPRTLERLGVAALLALPAAATVFLSFNAGGFYPDATALVAGLAALVLAHRAAFSRHALGSLSRPAAIAAGALALYALWTLLSATWSGSLGRALVEFDRVLLYLLVFLLFASLPRTPARLQWLVRAVALAITVVAGAALVSRTFPDVFPTEAGLVPYRLAFPITYWNSLGLLGAVGLVLGLHLTSSMREAPAFRVAAAAVMPLLSAMVLLTLSRGAMLVGGLGLLAYAVLARPRALVSGLLAALPWSALALAATYDAHLLVSLEPTTPAAVAQGHRLAWIVGAAVLGAAASRAALLLLDRWLRRAMPRRWLSRSEARLVAVVAATFALVLALGLGASGAIAGQLERVLGQSDQAAVARDPRTRLTDPSAGLRIAGWRAAVEGFRTSQLTGQGAGSYESLWREKRPVPLSAKDAHSLYLETLSELGLIGLLLLGVAFAAILVGTAKHARGRNRSVYVAVLVAAVVWLLHAGIDWDWELPAVTVWFFALTGAALARPRDTAGRSKRSSPVARVAIALALVAIAVLPGVLMVSQDKLDDSIRALDDRNCSKAIDDANASIAALPVRPEPYEVRGFCQVYVEAPEQGLRSMQEAVARDPNNWELHFALAVAEAATGQRPRSSIEAALHLNPREPALQQALLRLNTASDSTRELRQWALIESDPAELDFPWAGL